MTNQYQEKSISNQFRPAILQTFGDIAQAIGPHFEMYLTVVAQVLQAAAGVTMGENAAFEMLDYIISLREGIMDAWSGAILAMKSKRTCAITKLRYTLINYSRSVDAVCRANFYYTQRCRTRSEQKRSSPTVSYGRNWVSPPNLPPKARLISVQRFGGHISQRRMC